MKVQQKLMLHASIPDDDERLWTGNAIDAGSEWEGGKDGAQAAASGRLNSTFCYWEFMGVCR